MEISSNKFEIERLAITESGISYSVHNDMPFGCIRNDGSTDVQMWSTDVNNYFTIKAGSMLPYLKCATDTVLNFKSISGSGILEILWWG